MKSMNIASTASRSLARADVRHQRRIGHSALAALVAVGVAVVSTSLAAPTPASPPLADAPGGASSPLEAACQVGDPEACNDLGVTSLGGYGKPADVSGAARAFQRSCDAGSPDGCGNLGALYESGAGVTADVAEAARLYAHACTLGGALGCSNLGALYARGRGVERDLGEAQRLFERACATGSAAGCSNLLRFTEPRR